MPSATKQTTAVGLDIPVIEIRQTELGDYTVAFETHRDDFNPAPLFVGLPDDRCQCTHLGYVQQGKITFHYAHGDETFSAGEAYVALPGHTPEIHANSEVVEFTLTSEAEKTAAVLEKNMAAMEGAS